VLIGLSSSGVHSNGFSLVRRVLKEAGISLNDCVPEVDPSRPLGEVLLEPTRIYVRQVLDLTKRFPVKGMAHITGGGMVENIPRMLPPSCRAVVDRSSWRPGPLFDWLARTGNISKEDMYQTFNMGIGFVLAVPQEEASHVLGALHQMKEEACVIGRIAEGNRDLIWEDSGHEG
jgi:phosphoribosylformylglycinamidine cyclo-ligase